DDRAEFEDAWSSTLCRRFFHPVARTALVGPAPAVAADSTALRLPPEPENQAEFGVLTDTGSQPDVLARAFLRSR
ncbi:MAG: hypothetical protein ACREDU_10350, partial [Methylocella sp.]